MWRPSFRDVPEQVPRYARITSRITSRMVAEGTPSPPVTEPGG